MGAQFFFLFLELSIRKLWIFGFLEFWNFGFLEVWIFGTLDFWNLELLPLPSAVSGHSKAGKPTASLLGRWPCTPRSQYPPAPPCYAGPPSPKSAPGRRNFQAPESKFNIAGRHSEATATAGTKCPSTEAWTLTDLATWSLGRPSVPRQIVPASAVASE